MNPVKSYNVIVSNEPKSVEEIISIVKSGNRILKEDLLLFSNLNDNILSFEHQYNFNEKGNKGSLIKLEIIDPEKVFLSRFVGNSVKSLLSNNLTAGINKERFSEERRKENLAQKLKNSKLTTGTLGTVSPYGYSAPTAGINTTLNNFLLTNNATPLETKKINSFFSQKFSELGAGKLIDTSSFDSLINDLGLSALPNPPYPYLYFYYGEGDSKDSWAGPIMAQFTEANYNYSYETGQKSILLQFTSTHEFMGFSKLELQSRGKNLHIDPNYRLAFIGNRPTHPVGTYWLNNVQGQAGAGKDVIHSTIIKVLEDYIRKVTSDNANIMILIPDMNKFFGKVAEDYFKMVKPNVWSNPLFPTYNQYLGFYKLFADMGFDVFAATPVEMSGPKAFTDNDLGQPVDSSKFYEARSDFFGPGQEDAVEKFQLFSKGGLFGNKTQVVLAIGMRKTDEESVAAPLERFMGNVSNVITKLAPQFLVIDDPNFIKKFKTHCVSLGYSDIVINENYPLIIFGDMELIQLYLAGRIVYEDNKLYSKVVGTTIKGTPTGQQQANLNIQGKARDILHKREVEIFNDDYIKNIAVPTFLNIASDNPSFSLPSDAFDITVNSGNQNIRNAIKSLNIPIFKIGYAESNILDADVNIKDYFNAAITKIRFPKGQSDLIFTGISPENLELLNMVSKDGLGKLSKVLDNTSQNLPALKSELGKILLRDEKLNYLNKSPREKAKTTSEVVRFILSQKQKGGPAFSQLHDILRKKDPYLAYYQLLGDLVKNTYQGVIKTLPLFKLSRSPELLPPALLLIRDSSFVPYEAQTNGIIDSIRGFYNIMGYKHTISKSEVCSELFIIRQINLGGVP